MIQSQDFFSSSFFSQLHRLRIEKLTSNTLNLSSSSFPSPQDPEYKLKSANQTPTALSNALTNSHEISRNIMDERKAYIKGVSKKFKDCFVSKKIHPRESQC